MEKSQFILFIEPTRAEMPVAPTEDEVKLVKEHFAYLQERLAEGTLIHAGRTMEDPFVGIAIFEAEGIDGANRFTENDPGIRGGVFRVAGIQPYHVALIRG